MSDARAKLEMRAAAKLELVRRERAANTARPTTYGIYEPTGEYGGRLLRVLMQPDPQGPFIEVFGIPEPDVKVAVKLERFLTTPKRFKVAAGGRDGTKSFTFSDIFVSQAKDHGRKTMCLRELQNSLDDSVKAMLDAAVERLDFVDFGSTDKEIRFKGKAVFRFKGLHNNPGAVKSSFGFKRAWVEEAQTLSDESLTELTPTIREAGSELWFSMNPKSSADPMSQRFLKPFEKELIRDGYYEDDEHLIVMINWRDNPWHQELRKEREFDQEHMTRAKYQHVWEGAYNDEVENSIIPVEWFNAAIDAHLKLKFEARGAKVVSHDPSDSGFDPKGLAYRHGSVFKDIKEYETGDVNTGMDVATQYAIDVGADYFNWDCDGMGAPLRRQVSQALQGKHIEYEEYKGSESPPNPNQVYDPKAEGGKPRKIKDTFRNCRSYFYLRLRDRFYNTWRAVELDEYSDPEELISICSTVEDIDGLRAEVCRIPLKESNNKFTEIMSKIDMKRLHQLPSANRADAMKMSLAIGSKPRRDKKHRVQVPTNRARRMSKC